MKKNYFSKTSILLVCLTFILLTLGHANSRSSHDLYNYYDNPSDYISYTITGFNEDVIAETGNLGGTTTASVDKATDNYCYITNNVGISYGIPIDGVLSYGNIEYQLADFTGNNSLRLIGASNSLSGVGSPEEGNPTSGSISFTEAEQLETLYLAVTTGSGASIISGTIHFQDGSSQNFSSLSIPDWYANGTVVASNLGRGNRGNNALSGAPSGGPYIFQVSIDISIANQSKIVTGMTIQNDTSGDEVFNLFAVSGKVVPSCYSPTNLSLSAVSATAASLSWDESTGNTFEYAYVLDGEPAPTTYQAISNNNLDLSNLSSNTDYVFYLKTDCGLDGYSTPTTIAFTTLCDSVSSINEEFESDPSCWLIYNEASNSSYWDRLSSGQMRSWTVYNENADNYLVTPSFTVIEGSTDAISFAACRLFGDLELEVYLSSQGNTPLDFNELLETINPITVEYPDYDDSNNFGTYVVDIPSQYVGEEISIAFRVRGLASTTSNHIRLDNVFTTQSTLSVDNYNLNKIEVFPNPTKDILYIKNIDSETVINIYDILGKQININVVDNSIDVSTLKDGIYVLEIKHQNRAKSIRFVKN